MIVGNEIKRKDWRNYIFDDISSNVRSMITLGERQFISYITNELYEGFGYIVDLGPFVGAESVIFGDACARLSSKNSQIIIDYPIRAYDLFPDNISDPNWKNDQSTYLEYSNNISPYAEFIKTIKGDITAESWINKEIEILFNDISKSPEINAHVIKTFFPFLVPMRSVLIQQDYYDDHYWIPITMEILSSAFDIIEGPLGGTSAYVLKRNLTNEEIFAAATPSLDESILAIRAVQKRNIGWYKRLFRLCEARLLIQHKRISEAKNIIIEVEKDYPNHKVLQRRIDRIKSAINRFQVV